ncbi:MAG: LytTR family DNA-binding domain-containing protein [Myxococcaceae bacterium]
MADDEQLARSRLIRLLSAMPEVEVVGECADGDEVLSRIGEGDVDLVLLDIQMPKLKGTEALALWPEKGPMVVFCTAHAEHAVTAFDAGAVDYLLKPVEPARLKKALDRAREKDSQKRFRSELKQQREAGLPKLPVTTRQGVVLLDFDAITHAVLEDELVAVHTQQAQYLSDFTLQQLMERLPSERFERVHRRAVVNLEHVVRLEPLETGGYMARMRQGITVEVSRQSARDLRKRLGLRKAADD